MEFYEVIYTRRSVRSYSDKPIPREVLEKVLDAARVAPSGRNLQPWKFIVIDDEKIKRSLVPLCFHQEFIAEAPVVVVACGFRSTYNRGGYMGELSMLVDVSIAFTQLLLAARAEGLGTCWIGAFDNEGVKRLLKIPPGVEVVALTPLGYPREIDVWRPPKERKKLEEILCYNSYC